MYTFTLSSHLVHAAVHTRIDTESLIAMEKHSYQLCDDTQNYSFFCFDV